MHEEDKMPVTIYHNPACGTSRNTLAMIRASGVEPVSYTHLDVYKRQVFAWFRKKVVKTGFQHFHQIKNAVKSDRYLSLLIKERNFE